MTTTITITTTPMTTQDNHATVILQLDYHGSSNHDNIRLEIGNDFDTTINFAGEPEDLVVTGLNLDDGEDFSVVRSKPVTTKFLRFACKVNSCVKVISYLQSYVIMI